MTTPQQHEAGLLSEAMKKQKLNGPKAGELLGVTKQMISLYLNGPNRVTDERLIKWLTSPHQWVRDLAIEILVYRERLRLSVFAAAVPLPVA